MCIKSSCKGSSFLRRTTVLNPSAQEWRPPQHNHIPPLKPCVIFTPNSQPAAAPLPPQTAVQVVTVSAPPPQKLAWQLSPQLPYYHPLSFSSYQCFIPYGPCTESQPVYRSTPFSFPANGPFYEVAPPFFGCEKKYVGGGVEMNPEEKKLDKVESPIVRSRKRHQVAVRRTCFSPRMWRSVRSYSVDEKAPPRRQVWRPRKADSDSSVDGGAATSPRLCNSPSKQFFAAHPNEELSSSSITTVMIKNIPNQLRRDFMLEFLDGYCNEHSLEYDFFYLPMDFRKKDNLGYAFVNFTTGDAALKFKEILQNYRWETVKTERGSAFTSKKICDITWARIQGKEGLVKRFQNSNFACDKLNFLPVVFDPPRNGSNTKPAPPVILGRMHQHTKIY